MRQMLIPWEYAETEAEHTGVFGALLHMVGEHIAFFCHHIKWNGAMEFDLSVFFAINHELHLQIFTQL